MVLTNPLGVKTRSAIHKKNSLSHSRGVPYLTLHKHRVQEKNYVHKQIKYLSPIIFVHSANRTFSIIIHLRVVRVSIQFCGQFFLLKKITLQFSRVQFDSSILYIHLIRVLHTQIRDFNWSARIVNFVHNLVRKFEISICRRE